MELKKIVNSANQIMNDRVSIRKYDTSVKISRDEIANILQDAMTAPSSFNLQPWRFVVIDSEQGKESIKPFLMFNELQRETSSAIIAVFGDLESASTADKIYSGAVDHKLINSEVKDKMLNMIGTYTGSFTGERLSNGIMLDCGFVTMQIMLSAKNYGYDTNPIGGYMKKEMTEALGLDIKRYIPVILLSIGKSDEVARESIRYSVDEVTQWK